MKRESLIDELNEWTKVITDTNDRLRKRNEKLHNKINEINTKIYNDFAVKKVKRRIIQICSDVDNVHCLCNDGTVWIYFHQGVWKKINDIPQDEIKENETINDSEC